jgi:hypothetical protein
MSLLSIASPWTNDDLGSKKRVPTMRKTIKKLSSPSLPDPLHTSVRDTTDESDPLSATNMTHSLLKSSGIEAFQPLQEQSYSDAHNIPDSIKKIQSAQETRNERVSQLLNNITNVDAENSGQRLANFKPLSHPIIQKRTDVINGTLGTEGKEGFETLSNGYNPLQIPPPIIPERPAGAMLAINPKDLGVSNNPSTTNPYSNYNFSYSNKPLFAAKPNASQSNSLSQIDERLLEKINYMIHLLEEQKNEKTSNITEEFILYIFLGVFIIFIVDSFSKSGKYRR